MRNYILIWIARGIDGFGTQTSFVADGTREHSPDLEAQLQTYLSADPGRSIQFISPAYVLLDKANIISILKTLIVRYPQIWNSSWGWLQDGLRPKTSPRDIWIHPHHTAHDD